MKLSLWRVAEAPSLLAPEQDDVSWRPPAGGNEGAQHGQGHVDFEYEIAVALPGALAQHGRHVQARGHRVADARAVMEYLEIRTAGR